MSLYGKINFDNDFKNNDINKGSIEREPITYTEQQIEVKKSTITQEIDEHRRMTSAALQFQPIRRPPQTKKNTKKTISSISSSSFAPIKPHIVLQNVSSLDYWSHKDEDINENYDGTESRKAARNRKKKKKTKDNEVETILWDDPYDPFKPNDYEKYKMSDEAIQEIIDWKNKQGGNINLDDSGKYRNSEQFAPPANYSPQFSSTLPENLTPFNTIPSISLDETAEEAYARRVAMSQNKDIITNQPSYSIQSLYEKNTSVLSLPSPVKDTSDKNVEDIVSEEINQPIDTVHDKEHSQTSINNITIIREPQIYNINMADTQESSFTENNYQNLKIPESSEIQNNSNMPGQKKFAERLMKKYGWEKGKGLGASNDGIVNPLVVKHSKDRKGTGSIINKNRSYEKTGKFGKMSKVILLTNVSELETLDDDLSQEIGDECNKSYGKVERCFVYKNINSSLTSDLVRVFVLFTDSISALRAVNALDGRLFGGKEINVRFYDIDKFENGQYDA
ncbi:hypothetical protein PMAC_002228 [Pneumocystis sp. 'macacae']|nr:hypothetical protein PMAC_002228 [Pneumocystis sp. 'macacae']